MIISGKIRKNENGFWAIGEFEITSGSLVEIEIDGHWICGVIECCHDNYYWFRCKDGITVILHNGIRAQILSKKGDHKK